jgi:hypothetical protein
MPALRHPLGPAVEHDAHIIAGAFDEALEFVHERANGPVGILPPPSGPGSNHVHAVDDQPAGG